MRQKFLINLIQMKKTVVGWHATEKRLHFFILEERKETRVFEVVSEGCSTRVVILWEFGTDR